MNPAERAVLREIVATSVSQVFAGFGLATCEVDDVDASSVSWYHPVAIIGFAGKGIAGTACLATPWALLKKTYPCDYDSEGDLLDWSRELSNLLLGTLKTSLLARRISVEMGIPASVISADFRMQVSAGTPLLQLFRCEAAPFPTLLSAELGEGIDLTSVPTEPDQAPDLLLF